MSRLDQMMRQTPIRNREDVLRWLIELYELWGGDEAQQVSRRRQQIARMVFQVSGVTPGVVEGEEGEKLRSDNPLAWCIRLAINTLLDTTTGEDLARQRLQFKAAQSEFRCRPWQSGGSAWALATNSRPLRTPTSEVQRNLARPAYPRRLASKTQLSLAILYHPGCSEPKAAGVTARL